MCPLKRLVRFIGLAAAVVSSLAMADDFSDIVTPPEVSLPDPVAIGALEFAPLTVGGENHAFLSSWIEAQVSGAFSRSSARNNGATQNVRVEGAGGGGPLEVNICSASAPSNSNQPITQICIISGVSIGK